jgi:hypothetical protein
MNKTIEHLYVIVILLILSSCAPAPGMVDGAVEGLQYGTSLWIANQALVSNHMDAIRLVKTGSDQVLLGACMPGCDTSWGFIALDGAKKVGMDAALKFGGNVSNWSTFRGLADDLKLQGWKPVAPSDLPSSILIGVDAALAGFSQAARWIAYAPVTFIVIPAGWEALPEFMQPVEMH